MTSTQQRSAAGEKDLLPGGIEDIIPVASTVEQTVQRIMRETGLAGTPKQSSDEAARESICANRKP